MEYTKSGTTDLRIFLPARPGASRGNVAHLFRTDGWLCFNHSLSLSLSFCLSPYLSLGNWISCL